MRITVLGSGSKGNCLVVDTGGARIALDAGFGTRTLAKRFKSANLDPESVDACVITHEHTDHACSALKVRDRWRWTLIATPQTLDAIGTGNASARIVPLAHRVAYTVGDANVTLISVSHDAVSPSAVLIEDAKTGARVGVAYDLGEIPEGLADTFSNLDMLVLEANHDMVMLRNGPYPFVLQERIASRRGHLSNLQAAHFAARVSHRGLRAVVLAHLSEENNTAETARGTVGRALKAAAFKGTLIAAKQASACAIGVKRSEQLALF